MIPARFVKPLKTSIVVAFATVAGVMEATAQSTSLTRTGQQTETVVETEDRKLFKLYNTAYYAYLRRDFELARIKFRELLGKAKPGGAFAKTSRQYLSELEGPSLEQKAVRRQPESTTQAARKPFTSPSPSSTSRLPGTPTPSTTRNRALPLDARAPDGAYTARTEPLRPERRASREIPNYARELLQEHKNRTAQTGTEQVRERSFDQRQPNWRPRKSKRRSAYRRRDRRMRRMNNRFRNLFGDRFFFGSNVHTLSLDDETQLQRQATWLSRRPGIKVTIVGHAADAGGESHNFDLSERRARAVRETLLRYGLNDADVSIDARGDTQPIAMCSSRECDAQNRRVVVNIERISPQSAMSRRRYGRTPQSR